MAELVLYRKYRPKGFDEVVGQEHVVSALLGALKQGKVAHAYLFSGPRGVGKTTVARLIAKALNCEDKDKPCNSCGPCNDFNENRSFDLIEIDAASNRGIDEIRELRDGVRFVPTKGKYKTYIIDEAHMLTKDAFNAFLKTLEEPPAHAVFVLATTELEKVPATIVSRTQHFDFRRPNAVQIAGRLSLVAKKEGIELHPDGAKLIALAAEGSLRDAEGILGQIMAVEDKVPRPPGGAGIPVAEGDLGKITRKEVEDILGLPRRESAKKMWEFIARKDAPAALSLVQELHDAGHDLTHFSKLLMHYFRNALFLKTDPSLKKFIEAEMLPDELEAIEAHLPSFQAADLTRGLDVIFTNLQSFKKTPIPQLPLEVTVVELISGTDGKTLA